MPVSLSALEHYEYCPRQCALIHVDGIWVENQHTTRGQRFHRRVDAGRTTRPPDRRGDDVKVLRGLQLWSERHDLVGRADAVEVRGEEYVPIEYKAGTRHGLAAAVQVCAQALCIEEMFGVDVAEGAVWYGRHRRRERVALTPELRAHTVELISLVARLGTAERLPPPADDARCKECQLIGFCMPSETSGSPDRASRYVRAEIFGDGR